MLHLVLPVGDRHPIHNYEVADLTELAALPVTADDIGAVAQVGSNKVFYILESIGTPNVWTPLARDVISLVIGDETTAITTGAGKYTFLMPIAFALYSIKAALSVAQTSGSIFTVDINVAAVTILATKLTIDNTERTSATAATPAVITASSIAENAVVTIDVDQVGDGTAKGLKIYLIGRYT